MEHQSLVHNVLYWSFVAGGLVGVALVYLSAKMRFINMPRWVLIPATLICFAPAVGGIVMFPAGLIVFLWGSCSGKMAKLGKWLTEDI